MSAPVGLTPTGRLVFHPLGFHTGERMTDIRLTIEHPTTGSAWSGLHDARASIYRYDGAGG